MVTQSGNSGAELIIVTIRNMVMVAQWLWGQTAWGTGAARSLTVVSQHLPFKDQRDEGTDYVLVACQALF